jgi:hypothetical protein
MKLMPNINNFITIFDSIPLEKSVGFFLPGTMAAIQITNTNWRNPTDLSPPTDEWNYSNNNSANKYSSVEFTRQWV